MINFLEDNIEEYIILDSENGKSIYYLISYKFEKNTLILECEGEKVCLKNIELNKIYLNDSFITFEIDNKNIRLIKF